MIDAQSTLRMSMIPGSGDMTPMNWIDQARASWGRYSVISRPIAADDTAQASCRSAP